MDQLLRGRRKLSEDLRHGLEGAVRACRGGVKRVHLLPRQTDGVLLRELFTREGVGTLLTAAPYEETRTARIEDVGGVLELLAPLEANGMLVRRSRELLETEIDRFTVVERDAMVIACAALYPYPDEQLGELACLAVHPAYRDSGRGEALLGCMEVKARELGIRRIFALSTQTIHWFLERGFVSAPIEALPMEKRELYNYRRNAKVVIKALD